MLGRAVVGAVLFGCAAAWSPPAAAAQEPDTASHAGPECDPAGKCVSSPEAGEARVIPSAPSELADGHENQSMPILAGLMLLAVGGLVVSVLNRLALDEGQG